MAPPSMWFAAAPHPRWRTCWWWRRSPTVGGQGGRLAVDALNRSDLVIVQHEYGLYDGSDGESLLEVIAAIDAPIVVVAHTVLSEPTPNQRLVLERVCAAAEAVVVMTETAEARLFAGFDVDHTKVSVIPHGAATPSAGPTVGATGSSERSPEC